MAGVSISLSESGRSSDRNSSSQSEKTASEYSKEDFIYVELLFNGLTYDMSGFAPGEAAPMPQLDHRFAFGGGDLPDAAVTKMEGLALMAGPHLSGAENSMPIMRTLVELATRLAAELDNVAAISWAPSRSIMGTDYFSKIMDGWLQGGPFPALGLTAFGVGADGGMRSEGLRFFTGQELRIAPELAQDRVSATKLAVRLINELVGKTPLQSPADIAGLAGERLVLLPSADGQFIELNPA